MLKIKSEKQLDTILYANEGDEGVRLDSFLAASSLGISRNYAAALIESGQVFVNGEDSVVKKYRVKAGDEIAVSIPEPVAADIEPEDIPIDIVYEDDDVIVINKVRGMVVHPGVANWTGTLVNAVMYHSGDSLSSINGEKRPGIVHRIDKNTSGLIMIAKNDKAHESLAAQLAEHSVTREYWAICLDNIKDDELTIDAPIGRDDKNRLRRAVYGIGAKEAVTHIRILERYGKHTLVAARLETGRTHQIRVHMQYIKHPLLCDDVYGGRNSRGLGAGYERAYGIGQILHAKLLGFVHPTTGEYMEFDSELPEYFRRAMELVK